MPPFVLLRGGGDLASGVAVRLHRAGIHVLITELAQPLAVRRSVAFSEAVYTGQVEVEGISGQHVVQLDEIQAAFTSKSIPVFIDPALTMLAGLTPVALVDARMTKRAPDIIANAADLVIGLGPGFIAGENCHAIVETVRGHNLGRVFWQGAAEADTGVPGSITQHGRDRVLRAPAAGRVQPQAEIGQHLNQGDLVAEVSGQELHAPFAGVLRGLINPSVEVSAGMKIGDLDPRNDPSFCWRVSDKALAIGGGVLEALLTRSEVRARLWA